MAAIMLSISDRTRFLVKLASLMFAVFIFLAFLSDDAAAGGSVGVDAIKTCSKNDITVTQGAVNPLPNGIPAFSVRVVNTCVTGCAMAEIHLSCGSFASARTINPKIFKRLAPNDCLVNDGKALKAGSSISFTYANSFRYPLKVASFKCSQ